jgi:hypothetical protein
MMKAKLIARPLLSGLFWATLFFSMFTAPVIMAARVADDGGRTAELIRQHQEAISPWPAAPDEAAAASGSCERAADEPMEQETSMDQAEPDSPMIRPVGKRSHRIQV